MKRWDRFDWVMLLVFVLGIGAVLVSQSIANGGPKWNIDRSKTARTTEPIRTLPEGLSVEDWDAIDKAKNTCNPDELWQLYLTTHEALNVSFATVSNSSTVSLHALARASRACNTWADHWGS